LEWSPVTFIHEMVVLETNVVVEDFDEELKVPTEIRCFGGLSSLNAAV
jgi:hypothetical protein